MWCSAADTHLKLMDRAVSGARFQTGGLLECDISHRRLCVCCIVYKIKYNPMHPFYGALPVPYVTVRVAHGVMVAHRYTYAPSRCTTSLYRIIYMPLYSVPVSLFLSDPVFDGVALADFKSRANSFLFA